MLTHGGWTRRTALLALAALLALLAGCSAREMAEPAYSLEERVGIAAAAGVAPDNLPIYRPANTGRAVLLLHGFRSTPWQMEKLADAFHERGYTVYAPLMPGHGTRVEDLAHTPWESWEREALGAYHALQQGHERVAVAGISMGGALALRIAEQERPAAVVAINAPVWLREPGAALAWLVKHWKEETIKPVEDNNGHYYDRIPLAAIDQLMELVSTTHRGLPRVTSPVLVIQSRDDETILPESARAIYLDLRSEKELVWREGSKHVITREPDVVKKVFDYVTAR